MKILLTAFGPFGGESVNPALESVRLVKAPEGVELVKKEIPTTFTLAGKTGVQAILEEKPDAVLCIGQAMGRADVVVERVAINVDDAKSPDNAGDIPCDRPIRADGPAAYFATLPIKRIVQAINDAGVPAKVSNSAGTFVCNHLMYSVLDELAAAHPGVRGGFIHVPAIPEQTNNRNPMPPSMELPVIVRAIEAALRAIAEEQ